MLPYKNHEPSFSDLDSTGPVDPDPEGQKITYIKEKSLNIFMLDVLYFLFRGLEGCPIA